VDSSAWPLGPAHAEVQFVCWIFPSFFSRHEWVTVDFGWFVVFSLFYGFTSLTLRRFYFLDLVLEQYTCCQN
jgi:hypothetical protein